MQASAVSRCNPLVVRHVAAVTWTLVTLVSQHKLIPWKKPKKKVFAVSYLVIFDLAVDSLVRLFGSIGEEVREVVASLGFKSLQELVGRSDLLEQISHIERIDLSDILRPAPLQFISEATRAAEEAAVSSDIRIAAGAEGLEFFPDSLSFDAPVVRNWSKVDAESRILGARYSSHRVRDRFDGSYDELTDSCAELD